MNSDGNSINKANYETIEFIDFDKNIFKDAIQDYLDSSIK